MSIDVPFSKYINGYTKPTSKPKKSQFDTFISISKLFFQLIDKRYEKRSTIFTTNINFSNWDSIFMDAVIANAILDPVSHHAHVVHITGKSYRLKDYIVDDE